MTLFANLITKKLRTSSCSNASVSEKLIIIALKIGSPKSIHAIRSELASDSIFLKTPRPSNSHNMNSAATLPRQSHPVSTSGHVSQMAASHDGQMDTSQVEVDPMASNHVSQIASSHAGPKVTSQVSQKASSHVPIASNRVSPMAGDAAPDDGEIPELPEPPAPVRKCAPPFGEGGLKPLVKEISRQVLRHHPSSLYEFIADYLHEKLREREMKKRGLQYPVPDETQSNKSLKETNLETLESTNNLGASMLNFLKDINVELEVAEHAALVIQTHYRGFLGRRKFEDAREIHEYLEQIWNLWLTPGRLANDDDQDLEYIVRHYGLTLDEANIFATKIQSFLRGAFQRHQLALAHPELAEHLKQLKVTHSEVNLKATAIQALFRGYLARKELKLKKLADQEHRISMLRANSTLPAHPESEDHSSLASILQSQRDEQKPSQPQIDASLKDMDV